ncbi:phosphate ABC transporter permease subunit PstC [Nocardioides marmoriginsengisoli]|uniref:Phosphate transport system permease protein n=1 Tax=Nocardioides marmoriginsengisoli TaxID=661483 RepID=A0A3N0CRH2_9ACTN|nr:phosphate ABC transporter permease subunit PstC [Nocardioides marmoriginsengisoli]RNL66064.1 phosphate ABC transporter permease subunit PstC [Nocardioides marmoriginsengisoli]
MSTVTTGTGSPKRRLGDLVFANLTRAAGLTILIALAGVGIFLTVEGIPAFGAGPDDLKGHSNLLTYVAPLVFGTLLAAVIALLIAVPLALGVALSISHYAPRRIAAGVGYLVDLLAAVPSVVYGLWGIAVLGPKLVPVYKWLASHFDWIPFFAGPASNTGRTIFTASIVLALMVLPIVTAITREIFAQTPRLNEEAALALGATRWEMIRLAVLPYGRSGIVSAAMLGLGRALGETMAVAMVLSASGVVTWNLISATNPSTIAANIALTFADATGTARNALIASGLVLFLITFVVNFSARAIVSRYEPGSK